jgi:hypothetical protein
MGRERHRERIQRMGAPSAGPLTGQALSVPAYMVLAELDAFVNNTMLRATFEAHRAAGAPWAMALEPDVPHHSLSPEQRELTVDWMRAILPLGTPARSARTRRRSAGSAIPRPARSRPSRRLPGTGARRAGSRRDRWPCNGRRSSGSDTHRTNKGYGDRSCSRSR